MDGGGGRGWGVGGGEARGLSQRGRIKGLEGWGGGGGRSRAIELLYALERPEHLGIKLFYAPAPPPCTVWALKPPSWSLHLLGVSLANICVCTRRYAGMHCNKSIVV